MRIAHGNRSLTSYSTKILCSFRHSNNTSYIISLSNFEEVKSKDTGLSLLKKYLIILSKRGIIFAIFHISGKTLRVKINGTICIKRDRLCTGELIGMVKFLYHQVIELYNNTSDIQLTTRHSIILSVEVSALNHIINAIVHMILFNYSSRLSLF